MTQNMVGLYLVVQTLLVSLVSSTTFAPGSPGDLIVFIRLYGFYRHYAINVGDGYIVHMTGPKNELPYQFFKCLFTRSCEKAEVKRERFEDFVKPGTLIIHIVNGTWEGIEPLPVSEIIERALSKVGTIHYHLLHNNCEHFARWCRYGEEASKQADNLKLGFYAGIAIVALIFIFTRKSSCLNGVENERGHVDFLARLVSSTTFTPGSPGDLIVFIRLYGFYRHYAINVGDGYIVHMTGPKNELPYQVFKYLFTGSCEKAEVKRERFEDFVKPGTRIYIENGTWDGIEPLPVSEIIERALSKVGTRDYHLLRNNCEHFARGCRYGEEASKQADNLKLGFYAGIAIVALIIIIIRKSSCLNGGENERGHVDFLEIISI